MGKENIYFKMEKIIKDFGWIIKKMDLVNSHGEIKIILKAIGNKMRCMEKVYCLTIKLIKK